MKSFFNRRGVFRSLVLSFALGALGASAGALAANKTSGTIYGEAQPNVTITATNRAGLTRQASSESSGYFQITALPPGVYTITSMKNGNVIATRTAEVTINSAAHVSFVGGGAQQLGTIKVVGGAINPIDVTNTTVGLSLSSSQFENLPVARSTRAITLLAPTVVPANPSLPDVDTTSFGGASPAENGYYLNGLNVTDYLNLVHYSRPPFEALAQYQVITGGMDSSFGGATGGILSLVTKSGTNTYHAGVNLFWTPQGLRANSPTVVVRVPDVASTEVNENLYLQYYSRREDYNQTNLSYNVYGSGPIVKDHLFFYALYQGTKQVSNNYTPTQFIHSENSDPQYLVKLDWQINDANLLEVTAYDSTHSTQQLRYTLAEKNAQYYDRSAGVPITTNDGGTAYIGRYTWVPTNNFNVSAMWGYVTFEHGEQSPSAATCPIAFDQRFGVTNRIGCWAQQIYTTPDAYSSRHEARIDAEWIIGNHDITFGYDQQVYYSKRFIHYSGGKLWVYLPNDPGAVTSPGSYDIPASASFYAKRRIFKTGAEFKNHQIAYYLQDKWRLGNWYLRYGVRVTSYSNDNGAGVTFIDISNNVAPRLGLSWDVFGDSSLKLFASASQYYIPTSGDQNQRLAASELNAYRFFTYDKIDPKTGAPIGKDPFTPTIYLNGANGEPSDPSSVISKNLEAMYSNEFIVGAKYQIGVTQWSVGLQFIHTELKNAIDDACGIDTPLIARGYVSLIKSYVREHYGKDAANGLPVCMTINPGQDVVADVGDQIVTIPGDQTGLPSASRIYNAIKLTFDRAFDGTFYLHGSLLWSHLYGNEEGYTWSTIGQVDAGITELFDFPGLMEGAYGDLAYDRTWTFKIFGAWNFAPEWQLGFSGQYYSGASLSCMGLYAGDIGTDHGRGSLAGASFYGNDTHYCFGKLYPQGSVGNGPAYYNINGSIHYMPEWAPGLEFAISVLNVFNFQNAVGVNQSGQLTSGGVNPSYRKPLAFQRPRAFRFSVQYNFL